MLKIGDGEVSGLAEALGGVGGVTSGLARRTLFSYLGGISLNAG
jgi:hypothetical protein